MAEGTFTQEATAKVAEPVAQTATQATEAPKQPVEKMIPESEARKLAEQEVLKVRQEGTRREKRLKELETKAQLSESQSRELTGLRESVGGLEEQLAALLDAQQVASGDGQSYTQRLRAKRDAAQATTAQPTQAQLRAIQEGVRLDELVADVGLEQDSEELDEARSLYQTKGFTAALKYLKGIKTKAPEKEQPRDELAELKKKLAAYEAKDKEVADSVDTSASMGTGPGKRIYTVAQLEDRSFVRENWKDIQLAEKEGRIKE
jgi:vancomycin resistance protein YoaR